MKKSFLKITSVLLLIIAISFFSCGDDDDDNNNTPDPVTKYDLVKIETTMGNMLIWLYDETPLHKNNFDSLTRAGFYDGLIFHRVINDFVIQGGDPSGNGTGGPGYKIPAEINSSLTHVYGAVGAARDNNPLKESNGSQFYIVENSAGTPNLNGDYTVFGITIDGLNVLSNIASVPTDGNDKPLTDVVMNKVQIVQYTADELKNQFNFTIP